VKRSVRLPWRSVKLVIGDYFEILDYSSWAVMKVRYKRLGPEITGYSIVLLSGSGDGSRTIRVFDSAHGFNEMHRYTRSDGKQTGKPFHSGSLGEGMRAAIKDTQDGYRQMIEGWER
jgi:hypothetical protein